MRVPLSTVVFGLASCGLFGLAIREDVREPDGPRAAWRHAAEAAEPPSVEEMDARIQAELEAERASDARKQAALAQLWGTSPATLGARWGAVQLGATLDDGVRRHVHIIETVTGAHVELDTDGDTIIGIDVIAGHECEAFRDRLREAWGAGVEAGEATYWTDPELGVRAAAEAAMGCHVRIERYADAQRWIDRKPEAVVPVAMIGQSRASLTAALQARPTVTRLEWTADTVAWQDVGVGRGAGRTALSASMVRERVASIQIHVEADVGTTAAIEDRLTELFGAASGDDVRRWRGPPAVSLTLGEGTSIELVVGAPAR